MHMYDLITKKKHGKALTDEELVFLIDGYVRGDIPDYRWRPCSWQSGSPA